MATSSTRRKAQLLALRPDFKVIEIRGNVARACASWPNNADWTPRFWPRPAWARLHFHITDGGPLDRRRRARRPAGGMMLDTDEMLPCVGQAAIGLEIRADDERIGGTLPRVERRGDLPMRDRRAGFLARDGRRLPDARSARTPRWPARNCTCAPSPFCRKSRGALKRGPRSTMPPAWASEWRRNSNKNHSGKIGRNCNG